MCTNYVVDGRLSSIYSSNMSGKVTVPLAQVSGSLRSRALELLVVEPLAELLRSYKNTYSTS